MAVSRVARAGCSIGFARSCTRMSGEALTSAKARASRPLTTIEDWVLGRARRVPLRTPEQLRQLQFHWGKPPPAADPSTLILTIHQGWQEPRDQLGPGLELVAALSPRDVQRDLHAEAEINRLRGFPAHGWFSLWGSAPRYRI